MGLKVTNNAFGTLNAGITSSSTTIVLNSGEGARFPTLGAGDYFYATLIDTSNNLEIVKVTARSTDTMTVVRAQDNTTARAYSTNDRFELRPTAALFNEIIQSIANIPPATPTQVSDQANTSTGYMMMPVGTTAQRPGTPASGMFRMNTTTGEPEWYDTVTASWIAFSDSPNYEVEYLVIAGGGSGDGTSPTNGSNSVFGSITAIGGGRGGASGSLSGSSGGSGGGASYQSGSGGSGTTGQGYSGGSNASAAYGGGGGGGAGGVGQNATSVVGGNGGAGITSSITGSAVARGGGGGGVGRSPSAGGTATAGGGNGGSSGVGSAGSANTGGGGGGGDGGGGAGGYRCSVQGESSGGGSSAETRLPVIAGTAYTVTVGAGGTGGAGGQGGSGIVVVRYAGAQRGTGGTVTFAGGYTIHTFTSSGTFTA